MEQSIFQKQISPFVQAAFAMSFNLVIILIVKGTVDTGSKIEDGTVLWEVSFSVLLAFMLFNSVLSISYKNKAEYFRNSIFSFLAVAAIGGVLAHYVSGVSMDSAGSFRWLYIVFTFTYLVFISIVNLMRKIMEIAKKQDARLRGEDLDN